MELYDHTYVTARREPLYGYSSAHGLANNALSPTTIQPDPMLRHNSAVPAGYASGVLIVEDSYQPITPQVSALPIQKSPSWMVPNAAALFPPQSFEVKTSPVRVLLSSKVWSPGGANSNSLFTPRNNYSGLAIQPASQATLTSGASTSWMSPSVKSSFFTPQSLRVNNYQAVIVNPPYEPFGVVAAKPFVTVQDHYSISSVQSALLKAAEWRPAASMYASDYLLVGPKPANLFVGHLEKPHELYVYAHVRVPDIWQILDLKSLKVFSVFIDDILELLGWFITTIQDAERIRAKLHLRERVKCLVKFLHKPLQLIPQSLRPIESVAH